MNCHELLILHDESMEINFGKKESIKKVELNKLRWGDYNQTTFYLKTE